MNKYHFDSFSNIPLLSLSEPESLPRIKTFTSEALSPELLYPSLKLAKQYTSLSHEIPLEDYSPKLKGEDQVLNKQSFLQHMTKEENEFLMRKLRKKPFDFGNFKHIKAINLFISLMIYVFISPFLIYSNVRCLFSCNLLELGVLSFN